MQKLWWCFVYRDIMIFFLAKDVTNTTENEINIGTNKTLLKKVKENYSNDAIRKFLLASGKLPPGKLPTIKLAPG